MPARVLAFAHAAPAAANGQMMLDCTLGDGGHAGLLLRDFPESLLVALDRDGSMIDRACNRIKNETAIWKRLRIVQSNYDNADVALQSLELKCRPFFILLDAGVSLHHFRGADRGFSYTDSDLDMRLDWPRASKSSEFLNPAARTESAHDLIHRLPQSELQYLFQELGEEPYSGRIARAICEARPIHTAADLARIIQQAVPRNRASRIHPATRVFQALRIAVNDELKSLQKALHILPEMLQPGGRLAIISFHSLEDRLVKQHFKAIGQKKRSRRKSYQVLDEAKFFIITPRPVRPELSEIQNNPAARSAVLRVLERSVDK